MDESHLDSSKQFRRRKKHLLKLILSQMEFYFGDSNLSKDRFLSNLIAKDPYIELETFLKFNKIKALTKKTEDLVSAIKKSKMLELSADGLKVKRITPVQVRDDVDKCTIYVERIPNDFTHDSLIEIFSDFGKVEYVSIPKYKDNQLMKGFAFVEFDTPESANKTLEHFASIGCRLSSQMPPEKLLSISTYVDEQKTEESQNKGVNITDSGKSEQTEERPDDGGSQENNEEQATEEKINKRSLENPESDTEGEELKKRKLSTENSETGDNSDASKAIESGKQKNKDSRKRKTSMDNQESEIKKYKSSEEYQESSTDGDELKSSCNLKNKEPRKRNHSMDQKNDEKKAKTGSVSGDSESGKQDETADENESKNSAEIVETEEEKHEEESNDENESVKRKRKRKKNQRRAVYDIKESGLHVLSKCEWKRLRNKYLDLQRSHMKNLKLQLNRSRFNSTSKNQKSSTSASSASDDGKKKTTFKSGTVVHLELPTPCADVRMFKMELRTYAPDLQYVDVKEGKFEAYVRFSNSKEACAFLKCPFAATMHLLSGDREKEYWSKIMKDRDEKFKKGKIKQRGRDKLLWKAEKELGKHIRFEEDSD